MINLEKPHLDKKIFVRQPVWFWGILLTLFISAFYIRVDNQIFQSGDRQYRSALIARAFFFEAVGGQPEWRQKVAEISRERAGLLEPPIMEWVVSVIYRLIDAEDLRVPRIIASFFWVIGGVFLFQIAQQLGTKVMAVFATAYYLFVPMGAFISVGFVPDPLMLMLFLAGVLAIIQYCEHPSLARLILSAGLSAAAILVKPFIAVASPAVFVFFAANQKESLKTIFNSHFFLFISILLMPVIFYYLHGILNKGFLLKQAQGSFRPELLLTKSYWRDWAETAVRVVGIAPLIATLIVFVIIPDGLQKMLLVSLWVGYIIFGLCFSHHIRFGAHYHSQLIVIVAFSMGFVIDRLTTLLKQSIKKWYGWSPVCIALLTVVTLNIKAVKAKTTPDLFKYIEPAREVGQQVKHSVRVVYVARAYGTPLEYYGELSGAYWPRRHQNRNTTGAGLTIQDRLNALGFTPEYFVITNFKEFNRHHPDLKQYLTEQCLLVVQNKNYHIYKT